MKKLIYIMFTILLVIGCGHSKPAEERQHVFHTYYGDIDIDTMKVTLTDLDGSLCYAVNYIPSDSVEKLGGFVGHGSIVYYYNPQKNCYYMEYPTHDELGNAVIECDPSETWDK